MREVFSRPRGGRGESLVEVLASLLVGSLALLLLASMILVSARIIRQTEAADEAYYAALEKAEAREGAPLDTGTVTVDGVGFSVGYFGGDGVWSYQKTP